MDDEIFEQAKLILQESSCAIQKIHERFGYAGARSFREDFKGKSGRFPHKYRLEFLRAAKKSKKSARQDEIENAIDDVKSMIKNSKIAPIDLYRQIVDKTHHIKEFLARFKRETGVSVQEYHQKHGEQDDETNRIKAAKVLLIDTNDSIEDISRALGYKNLSCLSHHFKKKTGIAPSYYRRDEKERALGTLIGALKQHNTLDLAS